ncbi:hypothetical protein PR048_001952 [Dryococelus australis]|uniref:Uncharacterized protein n=1 Tax=Dryococelus australis TaxID=614101 RepID=A0ABQ9IIT7_9NEOP|nr:hypothetical protein PR048_001952 [Dryococelus australis]
MVAYWLQRWRNQIWRLHDQTDRAGSPESKMATGAQLSNRATPTTLIKVKIGELGLLQVKGLSRLWSLWRNQLRETTEDQSEELTEEQIDVVLIVEVNVDLYVDVDMVVEQVGWYAQCFVVVDLTEEQSEELIEDQSEELIEDQSEELTERNSAELSKSLGRPSSVKLTFWLSAFSSGNSLSSSVILSCNPSSPSFPCPCRSAATPPFTLVPTAIPATPLHFCSGFGPSTLATPVRDVMWVTPNAYQALNTSPYPPGKGLNTSIPPGGFGGGHITLPPRLPGEQKSKQPTFPRLRVDTFPILNPPGLPGGPTSPTPFPPFGGHSHYPPGYRGKKNTPFPPYGGPFHPNLPGYRGETFTQTSRLKKGGTFQPPPGPQLKHHTTPRPQFGTSTTTKGSPVSPSPCIPALLHDHLTSPLSSQELDFKSRPNISTPLQSYSRFSLLACVVELMFFIQSGADQGAENSFTVDFVSCWMRWRMVSVAQRNQSGLGCHDREFCMKTFKFAARRVVFPASPEGAAVNLPPPA